MTTLYLTGHSLGGAMAALMAVMLSVEEDYVERFAPVFKGAYTYGAPMVGSPDFAEACAAHPFLDRNVVRYIYKRDPVPHLPPRDSDFFQHFGREYRYEGSYPWKDTSDDPTKQIGHLLGLHRVELGFAAQGDDDIDVSDELRVNEFGCLIGDVDADLAEGLGRKRVQGHSRLGARHADCGRRRCRVRRSGLDPT
jgi:hypothetical protein